MQQPLQHTTPNETTIAAYNRQQNYNLRSTAMSGYEANHPALDDPHAWVPYRYYPSLAAAAIFLVLFLLTTSAHAFLVSKRRTWYFTPFVVGGLCESLQFYIL
jgi:hypothetical protein